MKQQIPLPKTHRIAGIPLFLLILSVSIMAKDTCFLWSDVRHGTDVAVGIFTAPINFSAQDWNRTGLALAGTVTLFALDKRVKKLALNNQNPLNDVIFNVDKIHGNEYSLYLAGGVYTLGLITKKPAIRTTGLNAVEAYIFSGAITGIGKTLFGRKRPYASNSPVFFSPFHLTSNRYHSLPSGHTTVSFAVSTVMAKSWDNIAWKVFWYGNAGLVAASRIYHNKHWLSDTFLGAFIGYSVANYIVKSTPEKSSQRKYRVVPQMTFNSIGFDICLY